MPWEKPRHNSKKKIKPNMNTKNIYERLSPSLRGYNNQWRKIRAAILAEEPLCRTCQGPATVVDHIKPLKKGGTYDRLNLQPLCISCHNRKTWHETFALKSRKSNQKNPTNKNSKKKLP